jgi:hypothetical protein
MACCCQPRGWQNAHPFGPFAACLQASRVNMQVLAQELPKDFQIETEFLAQFDSLL